MSVQLQIYWQSVKRYWQLLYQLATILGCGVCVRVALRLVGPGEYFWLLEAPKVLIGAGPSVVAHLDCA